MEIKFTQHRKFHLVTMLNLFQSRLEGNQILGASGLFQKEISYWVLRGHGQLEPAESQSCRTPWCQTQSQKEARGAALA